MIIWVMYDIQKDKPRNKVAKACLRAGLYRVQYSVFLGTLKETEKDALSLEIEDLIDEDNDSVYMFPMNKKELKETTLMGQAFDKKLVTDEVKSMFH
jgi:CRISPR-associated protein Cas2